MPQTMIFGSKSLENLLVGPSRTVPADAPLGSLCLVQETGQVFVNTQEHVPAWTEISNGVEAEKPQIHDPWTCWYCDRLNSHILLECVGCGGPKKR